MCLRTYWMQWGILKREKFVFQDYKDVVDSDWLALSEKGLAVHDASELELPESRLTSDRPLVFVSCGQYADGEKEIGRRIVALIEEHSEAVGYFAENQQSLAGLSANILAALNRAAGMVVIMHKRGLVEIPSAEKFYRGSVWVEQETAIAAFLQSIGRTISVAAYIEDGIKREGLRDLLHLNPLIFTTADEIARDFEQKLRARTFVPNESPLASTTNARPLLGVEAEIVSPDESRARGIYPVSSAYRLLLHINNAGHGTAKNIVVRLIGASSSEQIVEPLAPAQGVYKPYYLEWRLSQPGDVGTPAEIQVIYDGDDSRDGAVILARVAGSNPPRWVVSERRQPS
jgi:hypothetical protein